MLYVVFYHNSFLTSSGTTFFSAEANFCGSAFCFPSALVLKRPHPTIRPVLARCITVVHAMNQTCTLTLPLGAFGNASSHSTHQGTHPCGSQNTGVFAHQNCSINRRPLVETHRTTVMVRSKVVREEAREASSLSSAAHSGEKRIPNRLP